MRQRGFTLLETLVALTVLALCFGVFLQAFSSNLRLGNASDRVVEASELADALLARAGTELPLDGLDSSGTGDGFVWRLSARDATPPPANDALPRLFAVTARIAWSEGGPGRQRSVTFSTYKLAEQP